MAEAAMQGANCSSAAIWGLLKNTLHAAGGSWDSNYLLLNIYREQMLGSSVTQLANQLTN